MSERVEKGADVALQIGRVAFAGHALARQDVTEIAYRSSATLPKVGGEVMVDGSLRKVLSARKGVNKGMIVIVVEGTD